jgi:plasmid stabilization system protein ParE
MIFEILIEDSADEDLDLAYRWIARRAPTRAESWLSGARTAIGTLHTFPRRCPLAPENDDFDTEVRQLL